MPVLDEQRAVRGRELMSVPRGGCLSFGQGYVSGLSTFKIHQALAVKHPACSLTHMKPVDSVFFNFKSTVNLNIILHVLSVVFLGHGEMDICQTTA